MRSRGAAPRAPYSSRVREWLVFAVTCAATTAAVCGRDAWRLGHTACLAPDDARLPTIAPAIVVEVVWTLATVLFCFRSRKAGAAAFAIVLWLGIDLACHARPGFWGLFALAAHVVEIAFVLALRRWTVRDVSSEGGDVVLAGACALGAGVAGVAFAPELVDGIFGVAVPAVLVPVVLVALAAWRIGRRRAWLRGAYAGTDASWRIVPARGAVTDTDGVRLVSLEGTPPALLLLADQANDPYRENLPIAAVVPATPPRLLTTSSLVLVLGAPLVLVLPLVAAALVRCDIGSSLPELTTHTDFELVSPGEEPRVPLRFALPIGRCESGTTDLTYSRQSTVDGRALAALQMPPSHTDFLQTASAVLANGDLRTRWIAVAMKVSPNDSDGGEGTWLYQATKSNVEKRSGSQSESEMTSSGESRGSKTLWASGVGAASAQEQEQIARARRGTGAAFPPWPLGKGARWRATRTTSEQGITSVATFEYTMTELDGDRMTLEKAFTAHATSTVPPPAAEHPYQLKSFDAHGRVTEMRDLHSLIPTSQVSDVEEVTEFALLGGNFGSGEHDVVQTQQRHVVTAARDGAR